MSVERGRQMLSAQGLNLFAVLGLDMLPGAVLSDLESAGVATGSYSRLIMIGHGGSLMWRRLNEAGLAGADPVDEYSVRFARCLVADHLDACDSHILYPGNLPVPLQQLGRIAGWHHDSPLGLGVNTEYGPWFGYRVLLLVQAEIPVSVESAGPSPCESCAGKPCITACPVDALSPVAMPDVAVCVDHRMRSGSGCAATCLARHACPAGSTHRYDAQQTGYFYGRSLESIRAWRANT